MGEDWKLNLTPFTSLCDEYVTDNKKPYAIADIISNINHNPINIT